MIIARGLPPGGLVPAAPGRSLPAGCTLQPKTRRESRRPSASRGALVSASGSRARARSVGIACRCPRRTPGTRLTRPAQGAATRGPPCWRSIWKSGPAPAVTAGSRPSGEQLLGVETGGAVPGGKSPRSRPRRAAAADAGRPGSEPAGDQAEQPQVRRRPGQRVVGLGQPPPVGRFPQRAHPVAQRRPHPASSGEAASSRSSTSIWGEEICDHSSAARIIGTLR